MARIIYPRTGLTGGTTTDLDGIDGSSLNDGDRAHVYVSGTFYSYLLDDDSGATENSPYVIAPDTNAGTKRWILQQAPWLDDTSQVFYQSNQVRDPQRMAWSVGHENYLGLIYPDVSGVNKHGANVLSGANAWQSIGYAGAAAQVVSDDTYVTVLDVTSGTGVVTNLFLPGVTSASDTVSLKITLDGNVLDEMTFTAANATDRFITGNIASLSTYSNCQAFAPWPDAANAGDQAARLPDGGAAFFNVVAPPQTQLGSTLCLRFMNSIKIEMKSSDVSTSSYRDYCGVAYLLDQ